MQVKAWKECITIPTYGVGDPDKNPMFLEKRVYQGSSGVVYPYPVIDKVYDHKEDKQWTALFIENKYLKVMVLPELGGRIQMALDKTNNYHFVYYNQVIKPALVGLTGPWISGGIEFNWPQHHRPTTFDPTDYCIEENADGSKTIWVNEYEIMFRTKCALGFTLHPDKAYIELQARLHNRTPFPQTFLWWANPAVAVDEHYQSVFPPDVHAVFDHGKRAVISYPMARGTYYKVDYSPGTDISFYNNIPVPTSYMAVNSRYNFVGGYHHKKRAGLMHVADHHVSPGKKQWTWGSGEFGKAWDKHLTDNDGPYFELMCGVYTDNQPDFSWIMPNEVREFRQYFMPYKEIGYVKNASIDAMVNMELENGQVSLQVYVTQDRYATVRLRKGHEVLYEVTKLLSPEKAYIKNMSISVTDPTMLTVEVLDENGRLLVDYTPLPEQELPLPEAAKPIPAPAAIQSVEELYMAGLHLEQYRHATYLPQDYYEEGLRRDATDIRSNNALGLLHLRRGSWKLAEKYFRAAVEKLNTHNPNPYDGEPLYNLGLSLKFQQRYEEAYTCLNKSAWNAAMQDNAWLQLAQISSIHQDWKTALAHVEASLSRNNFSTRARHLKTLILRNSGQLEKAIVWAADSIEKELFDFGNRFEIYLLLELLGKQSEADKQLEDMCELMRNNAQTYLEISLDLAQAGDYLSAGRLLKLIAHTSAYPLVFYYLGYYSWKDGKQEEAVQWMRKGSDCSPDRVFPNRLEDIEVLNLVFSLVPEDYKALYYLGNFYYSKRRYEDARSCWEKSMQLFDGFPTVLRNLSIAWCNKFDNREKGLRLLTKAFELDPADARVLFELDQLRKLMKWSPSNRLEYLRQYPSLVKERDDLYIEYITLYTLVGEWEQAASLLANHQFHPWEGGEGKTSGLHIQIQIMLAKKKLAQQEYKAAIKHLLYAEQYPQNLGEGKLFGAQENDIHYWMGVALDKLGDIEGANNYWRKASRGPVQPTQAFFYNDQQPDKIFYQGMALQMLGEKAAAEDRFRTLINYGKNNYGKEVKMDFFAVSHPDLMIFDDDLSIRNNIHCLYLHALGEMGLANVEQAALLLGQLLEMEPAHTGGRIHMEWLDHTW